MGEEAAWGGGAILSGTGLSGSDRDERVSNLLDTSREAVGMVAQPAQLQNPPILLTDWPLPNLE